MKSSMWPIRNRSIKPVVWILVSAGCIVHLASAASCNTVFDFNGVNKTYSNCSLMNTNQDIVSIAWSYQLQNSTLDLAFTGELQTYGGWLGWGINPNCSIMPETSALIAFRAANGSYILPYKLGHSLYKARDSPELKCSTIDVEVLDRAVDIVNNSVTMYISVRLRPDQTTVNQVWGQGSYVKNFIPSAPCNYTSHNVATLDVNKGITNFGVRRKCPDLNFRLKTIHGLLTGVGYGLLYPVVTLMSICLWFSKRVCFPYFIVQAMAYLIGTLGFIYGHVLHDRHVWRDDDSPGDLRHHRRMGTAIVVLSSIQLALSILRLLARNAVDDNYEENVKRTYLTVSCMIGYALSILIVLTIFDGIDLMETTSGWKTAYTVIAIFSLLCVSGGGESGGG